MARWIGVLGLTEAAVAGNAAAHPPYPDYGGSTHVSPAVSGSLDNLFDTGPLTPASTMPSFVDSVPDRTYTTDTPDTETMNARIWNGFHFRTPMTDGRQRPRPLRRRLRHR